MQPVLQDEKAKESAAIGGRKTNLRIPSAWVGRAIAWATKLAAGGFIRLRLEGTEHFRQYVQDGRPIVFAGWHGHNFLTMCSYYKEVREQRKGAILVPESANGDAMRRIGEAIHLEVVQVKSGSGPSGWARATVSLIKLLRGGRFALLSPDGPEGPAYIAKAGIGVIAQQAKAVIVPASAAARRGIRLRGRWDEHLIPLPFSRAVVYFGEPIDAAPPDGDAPSAEELRERIEAALHIGAQEAERLCRDAREARDDIK